MISLTKKDYIVVPRKPYVRVHVDETTSRPPTMASFVGVWRPFRWFVSAMVGQSACMAIGTSQERRRCDFCPALQ